MRPTRLAAFCSLALLSACAGNPQTASGPNGLNSGHGTDSSASEMRSGQQAMVPLGPVTEPGRLKGLNPLQVRSVLGKPVFTRRDAPAEIWQYRARACTLDLFLYDEGGSQSVAYYAVRSSPPVNERDCFDELTGRSRGVPTS